MSEKLSRVWSMTVILFAEYLNSKPFEYLKFLKRSLICHLFDYALQFYLS